MRGGDVRAEAVAALCDGAGARSWRAWHPYAKWRGAFWRLVALVDLGARGSDPRVAEMLDVVLGWLVSPRRRVGVAAATLEGRVRWCATQDGLGVWAASLLGHADDPRTRLMAESLAAWQWPDGGWNCDKRPSASHSSFHETHGPLRGLAAYHEETGEPGARTTARRAADFLLAHRLLRSHRTGRLIHPEFRKLHWPPYWHYDVLVGLRAVGSARDLSDPAASEALDVLEAARGPDGTWRTSGRRHWKGPRSTGSNVEVADLSQVAHVVVTDQARDVLRLAGREPAAAG